MDGPPNTPVYLLRVSDGFRTYILFTLSCFPLKLNLLHPLLCSLCPSHSAVPLGGLRNQDEQYFCLGVYVPFRWLVRSNAPAADSQPTAKKLPYSSVWSTDCMLQGLAYSFISVLKVAGLDSKSK